MGYPALFSFDGFLFYGSPVKLLPRSVRDSHGLHVQSVSEGPCTDSSRIIPWPHKIGVILIRQSSMKFMFFLRLKRFFVIFSSTVVESCKTTETLWKSMASACKSHCSSFNWVIGYWDIGKTRRNDKPVTAFLGSLVLASYLGHRSLSWKTNDCSWTLTSHSFTKSWAVLHDSAIVNGESTKSLIKTINLLLRIVSSFLLNNNDLSHVLHIVSKQFARYTQHNVVTPVAIWPYQQGVPAPFRCQCLLGVYRGTDGTLISTTSSAKN